MDDDEPGVTVEDLPEIYREGYLYAIEMARALHDPATDWDGFLEYLWEALVRVFGLDVDVDWPSDAPGASEATSSKRRRERRQGSSIPDRSGEHRVRDQLEGDSRPPRH